MPMPIAMATYGYGYVYVWLWMPCTMPCTMPLTYCATLSITADGGCRAPRTDDHGHSGDDGDDVAVSTMMTRRRRRRSSKWPFLSMESKRWSLNELCVIICIIFFGLGKKDDTNYDAWFAACSISCGAMKPKR